MVEIHLEIDAAGQAAFFAEGQYVRVVSGPLRGLEGQVKRVGAQTSLVLTVDILGRALEASVAPGDLEKMK